MRKTIMLCICILFCLITAPIFGYDSDSTSWVSKESIELQFGNNKAHFMNFRARFFNDDGSLVFSVFLKKLLNKVNFNFFIDNLKKTTDFFSFKNRWEGRASEDFSDINWKDKKFEIFSNNNVIQPIVVTAAPPSGGGGDDPPYPDWYFLDDQRVYLFNENGEDLEKNKQRMEETRKIINKKKAEYKLEYKYRYVDEEVLEIGRYMKHYNDIIIYELITLINSKYAESAGGPGNNKELYYPALSMLFLLLDIYEIEPEYIHLSVR